MPRQEVFLSEISNGRQVEVVKTYDRQFAREVFDLMDAAAKATLKDSLIANGTFDSSELPDLDGEELWEGIEEGSREDWQTFSYFVVGEGKDAKADALFVCSDWPTAEAFARSRLIAFAD